jgi:hypothetical protein
MKINWKCILLQFIFLSSFNLYAQVGIGTTAPDDSSILDVSSTSKGLLMPRLTTTERDNITLPATGLMIFNVTLIDSQLNVGTPLAPDWVGLKEIRKPMINFVVLGDNITTVSADAETVPGMTETPGIGTYLVQFNGQHKGLKIDQPYSTSRAIIDMDQIYQDLMALSVTDASHGISFGNGEVLFPGVYDVMSGTPTIDGALTLDGGGDPNSLFVIRSPEAISTTANAIVNLVNGATSNNIFWVSNAALSTAANTILKGSLVSRVGAISLGGNTNLEGRMFTSNGALTVAASCVLIIPPGASPIDLGVLEELVLFTANGAVTSDATSIVHGDAGTGLGAMTMAGDHDGIMFPAGTQAKPASTTTYSIYLNGEEVDNSSRSINAADSTVSLLAMVTTEALGEVIEVRWKVDNDGQSTLDNRSLSLTQSMQ